MHLLHENAKQFVILYLRLTPLLTFKRTKPGVENIAKSNTTKSINSKLLSIFFICLFATRSAYNRQNILRWSFSQRIFFSQLWKAKSEEKVNPNSCCRIASFQFHFVLFYKCGSVSGWQREQKPIHLFTFFGDKTERPSERVGERVSVRVRLSIYLSGDLSVIAFVLHRLFASSIYGILWI